MNHVKTVFIIFTLICSALSFGQEQSEERTLNVSYIHQVKSMDSNVFLGHNACAPTSATSIIRHYHLQPDPPAGKPAGYYVYNPYSVGSADMSGNRYDSRYAYDMNVSLQHIHSVNGAHGFVVIDDNGDWKGDPNRMRNLMTNHGLTVQGPVGTNIFQTVKDNVNNGLPLIGHIKFLKNGTWYWHYLIIIGYHDESGTNNDRIIVNDPYGDRNGTWNGSTNGIGLNYVESEFLDVTPIYPIGVFETAGTDGWKTDGRSQAFVVKYNQHIAKIGYPNNNHPQAPTQGTPLVHEWYGLWIQDFRQPDPNQSFGTDGQSAVILYPMTFATPPYYRAYLVQGGFWQWYKDPTNNAQVVLGAPQEDPTNLTNSGPSEQQFQNGWLEWTGFQVIKHTGTRPNFQAGPPQCNVTFTATSTGFLAPQSAHQQERSDKQRYVTYTTASSGPEIWNDGEFVGIAPVTVPRYQGATYHITARMAGYQERDTTITVGSADMTVPITLNQNSALTVTFPNGGEALDPGWVYNITWTGGNFSGTKIDLTRDDGATWECLTPNGTSNASHFFQWPAAGARSAKCRIRVSDYDNPSVFDVSDNTFQIDNVTTPLLKTSVIDLGPIFGYAGTTHVMTFNILNIGVGSLNWNITHDSPNLKVDPVSGSGNRNIGVSLDLNGKAVGSYEEMINISSNDGPRTIPVRYTVEPPGSNIVFSDGFNRMLLGSDWQVTGQASITNGQLELTHVPGGSKAFCLSAGNLKHASVEFDLVQAEPVPGHNITGVYLPYVDYLNYAEVYIQRSDGRVYLRRHYAGQTVQTSFPAVIAPGRYEASVYNDTLRFKNVNGSGTPINLSFIDHSVPSLAAGKIGLFATEEIRKIDNVVIRNLPYSALSIPSNKYIGNGSTGVLSDSLLLQNVGTTTVTGNINLTGSLAMDSSVVHLAVGQGRKYAIRVNLDNTGIGNHRDTVRVTYNGKVSSSIVSYTKNSVIGLWKMDGALGSNAKRKNETTNALLVESGVSSTADHSQVSDGAYGFNGAAYLQTDLSTQLDGLQKLTVEAWVKTTATSHDQIIGKWQMNGRSFIMNWFNDNRLYVYIAGYPTDTGGNSNAYASVSRDVNWHHLAFVYDGSLANAERLKIYYDGQPQTTTVGGTIPTTLTTLGASYPLIIGNYEASTSGPPHNGGIDYVRIQNIALTADDISFSYQGITQPPSGGDPVSVIGHWKMNGALNSNAKKTNEVTGGLLSETGVSSTTDHRNTQDEAYGFSGAGYLVTDLSTQLDGLQKLTVEAWVKTISTSHDQILGKWQNGGRSFLLNWFNDNRLYVYIAGYPTDTGGNSNAYTSVSRDANWHHLAFVYDGSLANADRLKLYYDGQPQATTVGGTIPPVLTTVGTSYPLIIGNYEASTSGPPHSGAIDFVKLHNAALSSTDISASYQATLTKRSEVEETAALPTVYHLYQNHPNPFNPVTTISFDIPTTTRATLTIYNIVGQKVAVLVDGSIEPGFHRIIWDASAYPAGVYLYELKTSLFRAIRKLALVK